MRRNSTRVSLHFFFNKFKLTYWNVWIKYLLGIFANVPLRRKTSDLYVTSCRLVFVLQVVSDSDVVAAMRNPRGLSWRHVMRYDVITLVHATKGAFFLWRLPDARIASEFLYSAMYWILVKTRLVLMLIQVTLLLSLSRARHYSSFDLNVDILIKWI